MFRHFRALFLTRTRDEWFETLRRDNLNVAKVLTLDEVFVDPHVLHRKMVIEVDDPRVGKVRQIGMAVKLGETPGDARKLSPILSENTEEVLLGLGYDLSEINRLRKAGAIA